MINENYKAAFTDSVTTLIEEMIEDRGERILAIQALIDAYADGTGCSPDAYELERLTDYILLEELTDGNPHKVLHNEYPIFSQMQLDRRQFGQRGTQKSNIAGEVTDENAVNYGTDGRNHGKPVRRKRGKAEQIFVDAAAKIRNKARSEQYARDIAASAVITYNVRENGGEWADEFVQCRGTGRRFVPEYV